eukprot:g15577.t1
METLLEDKSKAMADKSIAVAGKKKAAADKEEKTLDDDLMSVRLDHQQPDMLLRSSVSQGDGATKAGAGEGANEVAEAGDEAGYEAGLKDRIIVFLDDLQNFNEEAAEAARRRGVRLLRLVYVAGVAGVGLVVLRAANSSPAVVAYWSGTRTTAVLTVLKAESTRAEVGEKRGAKALSTDEEAAVNSGTRQDQGGRRVSGSVAVRDSHQDGRRRRLITSADDGEEDRDVLGELTEEQDAAAEATAEACADNNFSGGGVGKVVLLVIAILFTFNGLAIVCDEFFQASLEKISEVLGLTPDVAGATFLAAGSSAPELFTSIADVFGPSNSIGVGTIVGSAMFNVLVIVALSAAVAAKSGASDLIDHRVVARDVCFYTCSIILLVSSARDNKIQWFEALFMVLGYGLYIVFMVYNSRILAACSAPRERRASQQEQSRGRLYDVTDNQGRGDPMAEAAAAAVKSVTKGLKTRHSRDEPAVRQDNAGAGGDLVKAGTEEKPGTAAPVVMSNVVPAGGREDHNMGDDDEDDRLAWPKGWVQRFLFIFGLPFMVALSLTIPDCSRPKYEKYYIITFVMSITWISIISSYMVALATGAACILGVSAIVMGVLVLAVGTSVPDMIGSMIAAKNGEASGAKSIN